jgi:hypothetical protein
VRPMKDGTHTLQFNSDPRSASLAYLCAEVLEKRFDVGPFDPGPNRISENVRQNPVMLCHGCAMISKSDTVGQGMTSR